MMQLLLAILILLVIGTLLYMQHDRFGGTATGNRLAKMQGMPNFKDGVFENLEPTPAITEGTPYSKLLASLFFGKDARLRPDKPLPVVQTDLRKLPVDSNLYLWFGHSSYLLQIDGKKIVVDPVFSTYASPVRYAVRAFDMTYEYKAADLPDIDILVITHDHWDHLDYNTFMEIKDRVKHIVTGLGVGAHLEKWGYPADQITELYWDESAEVDGLKFTAAPGRHFSGRTFKRNTTLWSAFILQSTQQKIFIGGDSGYGTHFKTIGEKYGPFDYAILENGQYDAMWKYIHMQPEEVLTAAQDLKAHYTVPVHSSKFPLANHPWDEPLIRISKAAQVQDMPLVTPKIGQVVSLHHYQKFAEWWKE